MADRAVLFIDGNNWYHGLRAIRLPRLIDLDYAAISAKLLGPREWIGTRYYIGQMKQDWNRTDYANQRRFLSLIRQDDPRISVHLGRLEERPVENPLAGELRDFVEENSESLAGRVRLELLELAEEYEDVTTLKEKAVDVMLAVDMYRMAVRDEYEAAYLLSADGDYTPAVRAITELGKTVYAVSPGLFSSALDGACRAFIKLDRQWFDTCYRGN